MAAVITAKVSVPCPVILGQPADVTVTVTNSDPTTGASVTGISLVSAPANSANLVGTVILPVNGAVLVAASSTLYFPGTIVFNGAQIAGARASGSPSCDIYAVVMMDDLSVAVSPVVPVVPSRGVYTAPAAGEVRLDGGGVNTYMIASGPKGLALP